MEILVALVVAVVVGRLVFRIGMGRGTVMGLDGPLPAPKAVDTSALRVAEEAAEKRLERFRGR